MIHFQGSHFNRVARPLPFPAALPTCLPGQPTGAFVWVASRHAAMVIIDVIYTLIAMRKGEQAVKGFKRVEVALENKKY